METIIQLLKNDPTKAVSILTKGSKDVKIIQSLHKEYNELDRKIRDSQVGIIQKDKLVGKDDKKRIVKRVRVPIPVQNKIVDNATAFEVGMPVTITSNESNDFTDEILRLWKTNRLDSKLQEAIKLQKSELQCAILFYIQNLEKPNLVNKILGTNKNKEIKSKLLQNKNGIMTPYFDGFGDMKFFTWQFVLKENDKDINHTWVYDDTNVYELSDSTGKFILENTKKHGFDKIPVAYFSQEKTEWAKVEPLIDRLEVSLSKLGNENDYTGHPILKLYGKVESAPGKDEDGKVIILPQKETVDGKVISADADFLTNEHGPESVELELNQLEKYIYSMTSTPDISFENIKGIGAISGVAIKLMFLDAMIKAKMNEGKNRTMIERMQNILISGTITTTNTSFSNKVKNVLFETTFNSIIPEDIQTTVNTLAEGVDKGFISKRTAVKHAKFANDVDEELSEIEKVKEDV